MNLIFSFTNGTEWDGPYRLKFEVPKNWRNKPVDFFNEVMHIHYIPVADDTKYSLHKNAQTKACRLVSYITQTPTHT